MPRQSTLQNHLNTYIRTAVDYSPLLHPLPIVTISYPSMAIHSTPLFGSSQIGSQNMHLSLPIISGLSRLHGIWSKMISVPYMPHRIQQQDLPASACCMWYNIQTMPSLPPPLTCRWRTHDPDHHWESTICYDWLPGTTCVLERSSQGRSVLTTANHKRWYNEKSFLQQLSSIRSISIWDAAHVWQALPRQYQHYNQAQTISPQPSAIRLLCQLTYPRGAMLQNIWPEVRAMYDLLLPAWFKYPLQDMDPSILRSKITVRYYFQQDIQCPRFMRTRKQSRYLPATRRDRIYQGNCNMRRWTSLWPCRNPSNRLRPQMNWSWLHQR